MKFDVESVSGVRKKVNIVMPSDVVDQKLSQQYGKLKRTAKIKGFRPGKAPIGVLKKHYSGTVAEEVLNDILKESYPVILQKEGIQPISYPEFSGDKLTEGEDFSFSLSFEVRPEIDPVDYKEISIKKESVEVTEEDVTAELEKLQKQFATQHVAADRGVKNGDTVTIDFERFLDNEPVGEGNIESKDIEVGADSFLPGFDEKMLGLRKDEKCDIVTDFPDDYPLKELAGKSSLLKIEVKEIKGTDTPGLDDAFAKDVGDFKDFDSLKEKIRSDLNVSKADESKRSMQNELLNAIMVKNPFDVPETMVQKQAEYKNEEIKKQMLSYGMKPEELEGNLKEVKGKIHEDAKRQVRSGLILDAIGKKEAIEVSDEDIETYFKEMADSSGKSVEEVKKYFGDKREYLATNLLDNKILDFLISEAKIEEN